MPTEIKQIDSTASRLTTLRITGDMVLADALLLKRIATDIIEETGNRVEIDIADLSYIDSDAGSILKELSSMASVDLSGAEIFLQTAVDQAEGRG